MLQLSPFLKIYCSILAVLLGACMGSFLNCLAWRTVHHESVWKGRSHCDSCGHVLRAGDLVPVLSYVFLGGKCRYCGAKMSPRFVVSELIAAAAFLSILLRYDISLQTLQYLLFACVLLACSFADLEEYIIPDRFLIAGVVIRIAFILLSDDIGGGFLSALIGGGSTAAVLLLIVLVMEKVMKREAMGGGDIKLFFLTGLYFGWKVNLLCVLLSCIMGLVFAVATAKSREGNEDAKAFPFGPAIAAAAWICALWGQSLVDLYMGLF